MTPQPQQEFIISEFALNEVVANLKAARMYDVAELMLIELRPASSPPGAPSPELAGSYCGVSKGWLQERDATIRNQTLDEFCKGFIRYIQEAQLDSWTDEAIIDAVNCCKKAEESLRTPSTQEEA